MQDSVKLIKGVGEKTFEYLKNASINSVEDFFLCLPKRYIVYSIKNPNNIFEDSLICIKCRVISRISSVRLRGKVMA